MQIRQFVFDRVHVACIAALLAAPGVAHSQSVQPAGTVAGTATPRKLRDAADSSEAARAAYRAAVERLRSGDTTKAMMFLDSASRNWPTQPVYIESLLRVATQFRDTAMIRVALTRGTQLHIGLAASTTSAVEPFASSTALRALLNAQIALAAPFARSSAMHTLSDSMLFPEGVAADRRNGRVFVSSIHRRTIVSVSATGETRNFATDTAIGAVFSLAIDTLHNLLWATTTGHPAMKDWNAERRSDPQLIALDLSSGKVVRRIAIPSIGGRPQPGDLAVTSRGEVLVSDAVQPVLWKLPLNAKALVPISNRLFRSLQGVVPSPDGTTAWVADYSHGIFRVPLNTDFANTADSAAAAARVVRVADVSGQTTVGIDGMVRFGNTFVGVQNGVMPPRIVQLELDASGTRITRFTVLDQNPLAPSPTNATIVGNSLVYVANSLWDFLERDETIPAGAQLPRPLLLSLPLKPQRSAN